MHKVWIPALGYGRLAVCRGVVCIGLRTGPLLYLGADLLKHGGVGGVPVGHYRGQHHAAYGGSGSGVCTAARFSPECRPFRSSGPVLTHVYLLVGVVDRDMPVEPVVHWVYRDTYVGRPARGGHNQPVCTGQSFQQFAQPLTEHA